MTHAGAFRPGDTGPVVPLTEPVPDGGLVAVTVEPARRSRAFGRADFHVEPDLA